MDGREKSFYKGDSMPDITMCMNDICPRRKNCYRHEADPDPNWQSYSNFSECKSPYFDRYIEFLSKTYNEKE